MSHETKTLVRKLTTLRDLLRKNCGTGPGGFQPGNTCGRRGAGANNPEGSERRRRRGKRRKRRGPDRGLGDRTRAAQRRRSGRQNASRRQWRESLMKPDGSPEGRALYRTQAGERKDLADSLKADRKEQRKDAAKEIKGTAREIKSERKTQAKDQKQDRVKLKRTQEREVEKTHASFGKQRAKLDAKYEAQKPTAKDPEALDRAYVRRKQELDAERDERLSDLNAEHRQARDEMRVFQKVDREQLRDEHRERAEDARKEQRVAATDVNMSARESIGDLQFSHRGERAELRRDEQDAIRSDREDRQADDKSYSWVDAKATPDDGVPGAQAILTNALVATGHTEAWEAETLSDEQRRELLEAVVTEGKAWFRSTAEALIADIGETTEKALFGDAKAKVGAFFGRAKKHVRELFVAGVLAVTGPGPANPQEAIVQATQQQVTEQIQYLDRFHRQIVAEDKPLDKTFVTRAEMYGAAAHGAVIEAQRQAHIAAGKITEARRILGPAEEHCPECPVLASRGWVPIKRAVPIGRTVCRVNCRCWMEFR